MRLVPLGGVLALAAVLLAGCGGGDDQAKVEASLQHYLVRVVPQDVGLPVGVGTPRVKDNGCKERHVKAPYGVILGRQKTEKGVAMWSCLVKFGTVALPMVVAVNDRIEVVAAVNDTAAVTGPTHTYSNTPPEDKPNASQPSAGWSPYPKGRQRR